RPQSGVFGPGETARLDCLVEGKPRPRVTWRLNGVPIEEAPGSGRRAVRDGALVLSRLEPNDTLVAQCEAHNRHGRLLANAYIYVVGTWGARRGVTGHREPPSATGTLPWPPGPLHGHPQPLATLPLLRALTPGLEPALQDDRAFVFTNGTLRLGPAARGDGGPFTCRAHNAHSNASVVAHLEVKGAR
ncbi:NGCA protein, partial [Glaucidium brasilianum]|nr:NGCA protein [Glaucidium brasilianum]